jgi:hypothetical protein
VQLLPCPLATLAFHDVAFVNCGIVEYHNAGHRVRLLCYLVKEGNHIVAYGWPLLGSPRQFAAVTQDPEHIDALLVRLRRHCAHLANPGPSVLHRRVGAEARFVKIEQLALAVLVQLAQRGDYPSGAFEGLCVALFLSHTDNVCSLNTLP